MPWCRGKPTLHFLLPTLMPDSQHFWYLKNQEGTHARWVKGFTYRSVQLIFLTKLLLLFLKSYHEVESLLLEFARYAYSTGEIGAFGESFRCRWRWIAACNTKCWSCEYRDGSLRKVLPGDQRQVLVEHIPPLCSEQGNRGWLYICLQVFDLLHVSAISGL